RHPGPPAPPTARRRRLVRCSHPPSVKNRPIPYQGRPARLAGTLRPNGQESSRAPDTHVRSTTPPAAVQSPPPIDLERSVGLGPDRTSVAPLHLTMITQLEPRRSARKRHGCATGDGTANARRPSRRRRRRALAGGRPR